MELVLRHCGNALIGPGRAIIHQRPTRQFSEIAWKWLMVPGNAGCDESPFFCSHRPGGRGGGDVEENFSFSKKADTGPQDRALFVKRRGSTFWRSATWLWRHTGTWDFELLEQLTVGKRLILRSDAFGGRAISRAFRRWIGRRCESGLWAIKAKQKIITRVYKLNAADYARDAHTLTLAAPKLREALRTCPKRSETLREKCSVKGKDARAFKKRGNKIGTGNMKNSECCNKIYYESYGGWKEKRLICVGCSELCVLERDE